MTFVMAVKVFLQLFLHLHSRAKQLVLYVFQMMILFIYIHYDIQDTCWQRNCILQHLAGNSCLFSNDSAFFSPLALGVYRFGGALSSNHYEELIKLSRDLELTFSQQTLNISAWNLIINMLYVFSIMTTVGHNSWHA